MNFKMNVGLLLVYFLFSLAFAQVDKATGTITNDTTMARLRVNNCVFGGPKVDIYLNGEIAVNGGIPLTNRGWRSSYPFGYLFLEPGTHSVAVVPTGQGLDQAILNPLEVQVIAGHRYTVVIMGQPEDASHQALVIDETEVYDALGATTADTPHIAINNVKGAAGLTFILDGTVREDNVPYGSYQAAFWPSPTKPYKGLDLSLRDADNNVIANDGFSDEGRDWPLDFIDCIGGTAGVYGRDWGGSTSPGTSTLPALEFLKLFNTLEPGLPTFNTLLKAVEIAGLRDLLTTGGPFLLFVPTDEAFAALPKEQLDALMADPKVLGDVLKNHIIEGFFPEEWLPVVDGKPKPLSNMLGIELAISGLPTYELRHPRVINGIEIGEWDPFMVANGTRVGFTLGGLATPQSIGLNQLKSNR